MKYTDLPTYAKKLLYLRKTNNLTQSELCAILKLATPYYSTIESGRQPLSNKIANQICNYYGCTIDYLTIDSVPIEDTTFSFEDIEPTTSIVDELRHLIEMYDKGYITLEEFRKAKDKLLD